MDFGSRFRIETWGKFVLECCNKNDYGRDSEERKITSSFMFFLRGNLATWVSQKHKIIAPSLREAK